LEVKVPSIFYGYSPEENEPDISFGSAPEIRDNVYKAPLQDMPTNPSNPLYQAMDNQRGPTYQQEQQQQEEREPDISFANELEGGFSDTALGQAMNNANNAVAMTMNQDDEPDISFGSQEEMQTATPQLPAPTPVVPPQETSMTTQQEPNISFDTDRPLGSDAGPLYTEGTLSTFESSPPAGTQMFPGTLTEDDLGNVDGLGESIKTGLEEAGQRGRAQVPVDAPPVLPVDGTAPGGRVGDPSAPIGGSDFMSSDGLSLSDVLTEAGYDVEALTREYGNIFEEYDPTREQFARRRDTLAEAGLDLQRGSAQLDLQRTQGQLGRQAESLRARQADVAEDLAMQQQLFGLQEEERATGLSRLREGARSNLFGLYRQQDVTNGFAGAGARNMALDRARRAFTTDVGGRISSLADTRRSDIARQQAERSSARQQRQLGSQLSGVEAELGEQGFLQKAFENRLAGFDLSRQEQRLGLEQNVFGLRKDYESDVRGRLIDIIKSGGDLDKFKLREEMKGPNETDTGISGYNSFYDNIYNEPRERFG
jgi:hypothetical protein